MPWPYNRCANFLPPARVSQYAGQSSRPARPPSKKAHYRTRKSPRPWQKSNLSNAGEGVPICVDRRKLLDEKPLGKHIRGGLSQGWNIMKTTFWLGVLFWAACVAPLYAQRWLRRPPPPPAAKAVAAQPAVDPAVEAKYQVLVASLPPEEQAWVCTLQQNLGSFYLPIPECTVRGRPLELLGFCPRRSEIAPRAADRRFDLRAVTPCRCARDWPARPTCTRLPRTAAPRPTG